MFNGTISFSGHIFARGACIAVAISRQRSAYWLLLVGAEGHDGTGRAVGVSVGYLLLLTPGSTFTCTAYRYHRWRLLYLYACLPARCCLFCSHGAVCATTTFCCMPSAAIACNAMAVQATMPVKQALRTPSCVFSIQV